MLTVLWFVKIAIIWKISIPVDANIFINSTVKSDLIENTSKMLCSFHAKTIYVYFENGTSHGYPGKILHDLSDCGTSYITLRNRVKRAPFKKIADDGILMYLLIILHDVSQDIELRIIKKKSAAKHLSHVLLLIENNHANVTETWLRQSFKKFWRKWVFNIVIIFWHNEQFQVYRYNPFMHNFLIKVIPKNGKLPTEGELFPTTIPNMQGKPLRICMYDDGIRAIFNKNGKITGSDGLMSSYLVGRLNATGVIHHVSSYGNFSLRADICLREILHEIDDISLNIRFLALPTFYRRVEYTIVHSRDDLCVLVPKAKIASTFWNLFRSFEVLVWLVILVSIPLAYGFCLAMDHILSVTEIVLLQLFANTLSIPWTRISVRHSRRLFLFHWLVYGMLICNAYKGNLTSNILFRRYLPDINTIKDLALSPYNILMFVRHIKHLDNFLNISNPYEAMIKQKMTPIPDDEVQEHIRTNNLSYAYLQKFHVAKFQANARPHMWHGRPLYHVMSTCLVPFHAIFIVPYGSPYLGFLNSLVRSSHEFGFSSYWDRKMNYEFIKSGKKAVRQKYDDDPVVLKLSHLQAAFCLLGLGLLAAILAFLWEVLCKRNGKNKVVC